MIAMYIPIIQIAVQMGMFFYIKHQMEHQKQTSMLQSLISHQVEIGRDF